MHLREACLEVMESPGMGSKYPDGMNAGDILTEIRAKHGADAFSLCTILDVCDEMTALYGRGRQP